MKKVFSLFIFLVLSARADHPNEGQFTLEQLLKEAELNNLTIQAQEKVVESAKNQVAEKSASYYPQLSLEGGPLSTKYNEEKNNGVAMYGKLEWNLYRGGSEQALIDIAKINSALLEQKLKTEKLNVRREIFKVYYEILFVLESVALKEKAIQMNQDQMKLAQLKKSSGFTSNTDVIEFELREATLKSDLILLYQERDQKSRELATLLGRKEAAEEILVKGHLHREKLALSKEQVLANYEASNFDFIQAHAELAISEKEKKIAFSGFLPKLNFEAKYGKLASEEKVFQDSDNYSLMLKVTIPIFSGFETQSSTRAINSDIASKAILLSNKRLIFKSELENLVSLLKTFSDRLDLEEKNLNRAEEYYKLTMGEYKRGVKNSPDMVGASERLLETKIRNLEYRKDYYLTKLKLYDLLNADPNTKL